MLKKYMPSALADGYRNIRLRNYMGYRNIRLRNYMLWKGTYRIFCISMQRTGTTSVGGFFAHFGYPVARWQYLRSEQWTTFWYNGDFESIFNSKVFQSFQVFEDTPWWVPDFYKVLYHRFPTAKFILFTRDADAWFESMLSFQRPNNRKY